MKKPLDPQPRRWPGLCAGPIRVSPPVEREVIADGVRPGVTEADAGTCAAPTTTVSQSKRT